MRNVTGAPAEGSDFLDRPAEWLRFRRELDNGANLVISAPRRVGKTSLALEACRPAADADAVSATIARLLLVLQRDGYLAAHGGAYAFRSFLLREFWFRREVR